MQIQLELLVSCMPAHLAIFSWRTVLWYVLVYTMAETSVGLIHWQATITVIVQWYRCLDVLLSHGTYHILFA